mmetsp:Transcript_91424/g.241759  ORF Transcript_91424/g.241759 Transcript_91424/m.241759 type:complete len:274 (-) Transcript_91424:33-854(-)
MALAAVSSVPWNSQTSLTELSRVVVAEKPSRSDVSGCTSSIRAPLARISARFWVYLSQSDESSMRSHRTTARSGIVFWSSLVPMLLTYSPLTSRWNGGPSSCHPTEDVQYQGGQVPPLSRMSHSASCPQWPHSPRRWEQLLQHALNTLPSSPTLARRPQPPPQKPLSCFCSQSWLWRPPPLQRAQQLSNLPKAYRPQPLEHMLPACRLQRAERPVGTTATCDASSDGPSGSAPPDLFCAVVSTGAWTCEWQMPIASPAGPANRSRARPKAQMF